MIATNDCVSVEVRVIYFKYFCFFSFYFFNYKEGTGKFWKQGESPWSQI